MPAPTKKGISISYNTFCTVQCLFTQKVANNNFLIASLLRKIFFPWKDVGQTKWRIRGQAAKYFLSQYQKSNVWDVVDMFRLVNIFAQYYFLPLPCRMHSSSADSWKPWSSTKNPKLVEKSKPENQNKIWSTRCLVKTKQSVNLLNFLGRFLAPGKCAKRCKTETFHIFHLSL